MRLVSRVVASPTSHCRPTALLFSGESRHSGSVTRRPVPQSLAEGHHGHTPSAPERARGAHSGLAVVPGMADGGGNGPEAIQTATRRVEADLLPSR